MNGPGSDPSFDKPAKNTIKKNLFGYKLEEFEYRLGIKESELILDM